jgi:hypothetical protein
METGPERGMVKGFRPALFVGFDSAWADKISVPGAICSVRFNGNGFTDFRPPEPRGFDGALDYIQSLRRPETPTLLALDQPTLVPNETGMRHVEKVVASLISWMGGGVQPANRGLRLFRDDAPIRGFLTKLGATEDPEAARTAKRGLYLMEVFPALALASLDASFFGRGKGPPLQSRPSKDVSGRALAHSRRRGPVRGRVVWMLVGSRVVGRAASKSLAEKTRPGLSRRRPLPAHRNPLAVWRAQSVRRHRRLEERVHRDAGVRTRHGTAIEGGKGAWCVDKRSGEAQLRPRPTTMSQVVNDQRRAAPCMDANIFVDRRI